MIGVPLGALLRAHQPDADDDARALRLRTWRRWALVALAATTAACVTGALITVAWVITPPPASLTSQAASPGVRIEDRHGVLLRSTRAEDGSRTRWVPMEEMDPDVILAFVAVEDRRFWDHGGIDARAVARAARDNVREGRIVSGASTITMQLARLLRPGERGWTSKAREALWALRLERHLGKQQILEQYLNRVHLGQAAVGVGAASALYFGAAASELSVGESAMLAGLAHAPSRDNPLVSPRRAVARRAVAIARMRRAGAIGRDAAQQATSEPGVVRTAPTPFLAPHFTTRLLASDAAGSTANAVWRTTLDAALQRELEGEVRHAVEMMAGRGVRHGAVVVLENRTGDVLAWVGSPDFRAEMAGQTDMVISARQPGSALKPFLYALAFDRGTTAATVLPDVPRSYATATGAYQPRNYDRRFRGPVRAREALASSYNVPAVELANRVGAGALLHTLRLAGFESLSRDAEHYGLGLALGNGDVTLLEVANAYRGLANGGVWTPHAWLVDRADRAGLGGAGRRASGQPAEARRFVSEASAALVLDIMSDASARVPGFGLETPFEFPFPAAVKTGTSRHFTDNWAVATTGGFTVAVWVGNFSGQPMQGVSGVTGAGPLLHRAVLLTAERYSARALPDPARHGLRAMEVCRLSGMLVTAGCPSVHEWFIAGTEPAMAEGWVRDGRVVLPPEYADWAAQGGVASLVTGVGPDLASDGREVAAGDGSDSLSRDRQDFRLLSPLDGDVYRVPPGVPTSYATIPLRVAGERRGVQWFVDGVAQTGSRWRLAPGTHVIRAEAGPNEVLEARITVE